MLDPDYELFVAAADLGSLSAAGRALAISPAMMSKRISRLERRVGTRLLHRSTRRLVLTAAGQRLHAEAARAIALLRDAEAAVRGDPAAPAGRLRVTAPTSFGRLHVAPHLAGFLERHPRVQLRLDLSDEFTDLYAGRFDLAIRITARVPRGLTAHRLATSRRVLCASPRYLKRHGEPRTIAALREHRLLAAGGQMPWRLSGGGRSRTFPGTSWVETNSSEVVRELAVAGAGIALRSLWDVSRELANGRLRRILAQYEGSADVAIFAMHPPLPIPDPLIDAFVAFLRGLFSPQPPWEE